MKHMVDIYPVGVLADLRGLVHAPREFRWAEARKLRHNFRDGWRRRSYWNGYLAEPVDCDYIPWTRAGHGWTRGRAWDDLQKHLGEFAKDPA